MPTQKRSLSWLSNSYRIYQFMETVVGRHPFHFGPQSDTLHPGGGAQWGVPWSSDSQPYWHIKITWRTSKTTPVRVLPAEPSLSGIGKAHPEPLKDDSTVPPSLGTTAVGSSAGPEIPDIWGQRLPRWPVFSFSRVRGFGEKHDKECMMCLENEGPRPLQGASGPVPMGVWTPLHPSPHTAPGPAQTVRIMEDWLLGVQRGQPVFFGFLCWSTRSQKRTVGACTKNPKDRRTLFQQIHL